MSTAQGSKSRQRTTTLGVSRPSGRLSTTAENYLLSLFILMEDGVAPHISQLAAYLRRLPVEEELGTTLASVSGMVHRMAKEGLLTINKGKEIHLTPEGERRGLYIVRRHRLAERLLVDLLQVPIERAEIEAHQLEHAISPRLLERVQEKLGNPDTCPFGRPIYREGEERRADPPGMIRLTESANGKEYTVMRIPDEDFNLLSFLVDNKILPGQRVRIHDNAPYRGVIDLTRNGATVSVGLTVAARIRVLPA
jgi:DtxR family transcriptional regulator, Mn-dependent transcriptional regulator